MEKTYQSSYIQPRFGDAPLLHVKALPLGIENIQYCNNIIDIVKANGGRIIYSGVKTRDGRVKKRIQLPVTYLGAPDLTSPYTLQLMISVAPVRNQDVSEALIALDREINDYCDLVQRLNKNLEKVKGGPYGN